MRDDLASWPAPFESKQAAIEFFGGPSLKAEAWADGLEERNGGWWPRWDLDLLERSLREAFVGRDYWREWESIRCPVLAVRTLVDEDEHREMGERLPHAQLVPLGQVALAGCQLADGGLGLGKVRLGRRVHLDDVVVLLLARALLFGQRLLSLLDIEAGRRARIAFIGSVVLRGELATHREEQRQSGNLGVPADVSH